MPYKKRTTNNSTLHRVLGAHGKALKFGSAVSSFVVVVEPTRSFLVGVRTGFSKVKLYEFSVLINQNFKTLHLDTS